MKYVLTALAGTILGVAIFYFHVENTYENLGTSNDIWSTSTTEKGQTQMGINAVAVHSIFRQKPEQAISFNTIRDSNGNLLNHKNRYQVIGRNLPCRFWSITFYGEDDHLIPNDKNKYSISSQNIVLESDGSFVINISSDKPKDAKNWVPIGRSQDGREGIHPLLRLYDPSDEIRKNLATYPLPKILKS